MFCLLLCIVPETVKFQMKKPKSWLQYKNHFSSLKPVKTIWRNGLSLYPYISYWICRILYNTILNRAVLKNKKNAAPKHCLISSFSRKYGFNDRRRFCTGRVNILLWPETEHYVKVKKYSIFEPKNRSNTTRPPQIRELRVTGLWNDTADKTSQSRNEKTISRKRGNKWIKTFIKYNQWYIISNSWQPIIKLTPWTNSFWFS